MIRQATIYRCDRCGHETETPAGWALMHLRHECDGEACARAREAETAATTEYNDATEKARAAYERALTAAEKKRAIAVASRAG